MFDKIGDIIPPYAKKELMQSKKQISFNFNSSIQFYFA